jgi:hypothetical protein
MVVRVVITHRRPRCWEQIQLPPPLLPSAGLRPEESITTTALVDLSIIMSTIFAILFILTRSRNTKYRR